MTHTIITHALEGQLRALERAGCAAGILDLIDGLVEQGIREGRVTQQQVLEDLEIALWTARADLMMGDYEHCVHAEAWLRRVEGRAGSRGEWYELYARSLLLLGRLEESLDCARRGAAVQPGCPRIWLGLAALRSHFGDRRGALEAVDAGLSLQPKDPALLRRREEILRDDSLEQMEGVQNSHELPGILCDAQGLERAREALGARQWRTDGPYCYFSLDYANRSLECCFRANEAAASKLEPSWLKRLRDALCELDGEGRGWLEHATRGEHPAGLLELWAMVLHPNRSLTLSYLPQGMPRQPGDTLEVRFTPQLQVDEALPGNYHPQVYSPEELSAVKEHILSHFGDYTQVLHELISPDIRLDICVIPPGQGREYYTLVTCGMGARPMAIPHELRDRVPARAELLLCLPPHWRLERREEEWFWPVRCLRQLARLPGHSGGFLGLGHRVAKGDPLASNTALSGFLLVGLQDAGEGGERCILPSKEEVAFYQLIPLYREEMEFHESAGVGPLLGRMSRVSPVVDISRPNTCQPLND